MVYFFRNYGTRTLNQIFIKNLNVNANIGKSYWKTKSSYTLPYKLSVIIDLKKGWLEDSGANDDINKTISYAEVSDYILKYLKFKLDFANSNQLLDEIYQGLTKGTESGVTNLNQEYCDKITFILDDARNHLKLDNLSIQKGYHLEPSKLLQNAENSLLEVPVVDSVVKIENLRLLTKIGIFDFERSKKQYVLINLLASLDKILESQSSVNDFSNELVEDLSEHVENTEFLTIEALIQDVLQFVARKFHLDVTELKISKLNAVLNAEQVGISVKTESLQASRTNSPEKEFQVTPSKSVVYTNDGSVPDGEYIAYISFGTNQGSQISNIYLMMQSLRENPLVKILASSSLYETTPMYYLDQDKFINGALKISTSLKPLQLLKFVKTIEYQILNRVKKFNNGPRTIDLDIVLYGDIIFQNLDLVIPHTRMLERMFVLEPLSELLTPDFQHPVTKKAVVNYHYNLLAKDEPYGKIVVPLPREQSEDFALLSFDRTLIMGIINRTKNSFSDGGKNYELNDAFENSIKLINDGASIIDIGAISTKPGQVITEISPLEETNLIIPLIEKIRQHPQEKINQILISVDTFNSSTARASIESGADIINDISMGTYDSKMYDTVAELKAPYVINHTRGTPDIMNKLTSYEKNTNPEVIEFDNYQNKDSALVNGVSRELAECIEKALIAGVEKWQFILDPGIGFAKTTSQNVSLIKSIQQFSDYSVKFANDSFVSFKKLPILVGPSRKKFIKELTKDSDSNLIGTCGVVMACISQGVNIVRVHDVKDIKKICLLGDVFFNKSK